MSGALIVLGGAVFIALSIFFKFTPRLRVVVALTVGALLAGVVVRQVNTWLAKGISKIADPLGRWIGQNPDEVAVAIPSALGLALALTSRPESPELRLRDGFLVVTLSWLLASTFGALPYLLSGALGPLDAFFETVSGFTTTG